MKKLMILDGNSIINRAFYAIRFLSNSKGVQTNAIYGFLNILFKYQAEEKADYLCVAFDLPQPTFRHLKYDKYKANRKGMPDELAAQMPIIKDVLSAMNIKMLSLEGFEADDIIGTVARKCDEEDVKCVILTGDKDDLQLATEKVCVKLIVTKGGKTETTDYYGETVLEKLGVTPEEFIDVKGLMGDTSDNIPGVAGIGEKTAYSLIQKFKSIDNIYQDIENIDVTAGVRKKLVEGKNDAYLSRELAEIDKNVPIDFAPQMCEIKEYDNAKLLELLGELELTSIIKKLDLETAPKRETEFSSVSSEKEIIELKEKIRETKKMFFLADETSIAVSFGEGIVVTDANCDFSDIFSDSSVAKITHNIKESLIRFGKIENIAFDTEIAAYVLEPSRSEYSVSSLATDLLKYSIGDSLADKLKAVEELYKHLSEQIEKNNQKALYFAVELPLASVLADMQIEGVEADKDMLNSLSSEFADRISELEKRIYSIAGYEFNINSTKQLGQLLFEELGLPVAKKTKNGYSTDISVLEGLRGTNEIIDYIIEYRQYVKLKSTYTDGILSVINEKTGRVHSKFNQTVTNTGRISSTEPNLQNIPVRTKLGRNLRKIFRAKEGYVFVDADYSQIELRVLAHIADDEAMKEAFLAEKDIHTKTASEIFSTDISSVTDEMRTRAKAVNFGIVYGMGNFSLAKDLGISVKEARQYIENYLNTFSGVRRYMTDIVEEGKKNGYVTTLLNRRRYIPELASANHNVRAFGERVALNTPIQGSAADIIKIAMVKVYNRLKRDLPDAKLILQIHDELIVEAPKGSEEIAKKILKEEMENALVLNVPLKVDIKSGETWYDAK